MAKARRRRIWSGSHDCLARVRRAAASKSARRGTGAAMALLEQTWPPRNHTHAPKATPAHESHFGGVGISGRKISELRRRGRGLDGPDQFLRRLGQEL